jgi:hypothetical protein
MIGVGPDVMNWMVFASSPPLWVGRVLRLLSPRRLRVTVWIPRPSLRRRLHQSRRAEMLGWLRGRRQV